MNYILMDFIEHCANIGADPEIVDKLLEKNPPLKEAYSDFMLDLDRGFVGSLGGNVFLMPMLTPGECDGIMARAKGYDYNKNAEEFRDYQIDEAILEIVDPDLYGRLRASLLPKLNAYCLFLNSTPITKVESFQIAKYSPDGTPGTGWHHDKASDFTCVISLNPDDFDGGGTGVRLTPNTTHEISPLPKGHGMIFNGRSVQHRGLPVTSGERYLLVCWCSTREEA